MARAMVALYELELFRIDSDRYHARWQVSSSCVFEGPSVFPAHDKHVLKPMAHPTFVRPKLPPLKLGDRPSQSLLSGRPSDDLPDGVVLVENPERQWQILRELRHR